MTSFDIVGLLRTAVYKGISDIHLKINEPPAVRIAGKIVKTDFEPIGESDFYEIINILCPQTFRDKIYNRCNSCRFTTTRCARYKNYTVRKCCELFY